MILCLLKVIILDLFLINLETLKDQTRFVQIFFFFCNIVGLLMELIIYFLLEIRIDDNHIKLVSQFEEENIIVFFFFYIPYVTLCKQPLFNDFNCKYRINNVKTLPIIKLGSDL